MVLEDAMNMKG